MKYRHMFWIIALFCLASWPERAGAMTQTDTLSNPPEAIGRFYLAPEAGRPNLLLDSLRQLITVERGDFLRWLDYANSEQETLSAGNPKAHRQPWILAVFGLMLLFF